MTILEWLTILGFFVATGSAIVMAQRRAIESMVGKRLDEIQASVSRERRRLARHPELLRSFFRHSALPFHV